MTYTTAPATMHSGHDIRDERGHMVAIVHNPAADHARGAKIAALMAAAPHLLAALERITELADRLALKSLTLNPEVDYIIPQARAAIARATGAAQ